MAEGVWTSSYCLSVEGFPKLLYATMQKLGIKDRPEYEGREYEEHETERCEVTVYIGKSEDFPNIAEAWSMTATGFRFADTYQAVARKALRYLCQIYEKPITHEVLSTRRKRPTSLEDPHGALARTLLT